MRNKYILIGLVVVAIGLGFAAGWFVSQRVNPPHATGYSVRQGGYQFINPLLECEVDGSLENKSLERFKYKLMDLIDEKTSANPITHVSVYYRDLNNGPWFGINEKEDFSPASLLKVPMMIAYLKQAETNPDILNTQLTFNPEDIPLPNFTEQEHTLTPGMAYTVNDLIEKIIIDSDNDAFYLLTFSIDDAYINSIHGDLGLTIPNQDTPDDFISVKSYASLFRVLFNASYLSRDWSEFALGLLSQAKFKDGLVAGVPGTVIVAHKYGVYAEAGGSDRQMHDCGIVYYPGHPYLLCVMTRGTDFNELAATIKDISREVYQEIDSQYSGG